jgi:cold shock CspA family protein
MEALEPVIRTDFKHVRAYLEYTRAMLDAGEPISKCSATLGQCKLDGETEPAFVGLYGGLLYMDEKYAEAKTLWERAKDQRFNDEEMTRRQYRPMDPTDLKKRRRFEGIVQLTKPNFVLIQRESGPVVLAKATQIDSKPLEKGDKVTFELSFSLKGAFAENLQPM